MYLMVSVWMVCPRIRLWAWGNPVPEEGGTFPNLTIEENLMISCVSKKRRKMLQRIYHLFTICLSHWRLNQPCWLAPLVADSGKC